MQTPSIKADLRRLIEHARERQLAQIAALPQAERDATGTPERWAAKDHLAHTMYWKERLAERLEAAASGGPMAASEGDVQARNEENFAAHATQPWADVLADDARIHARVLAGLDALTDADLTEPGRFPALNGLPLIAAVMGNLGHTYEHLTQPNLDRSDVDGAIRVQESYTNDVLDCDLPPVAKARTLYDLAVFYTVIGRSDEALANLTETIHLYPPLAEWAKNEHAFDALRDEPDYQALYHEPE